MDSSVTSITKHVADGAAQTTALSTSAAYAYFLSTDFYLGVLVVTFFTLTAYIYALVQDIKKESQILDIVDYVKIAIKGFITSFFIAVMTLVVATYFQLDPFITIMTSSILGARPDLFRGLINFAGNIVDKAVRKWGE